METRFPVRIRRSRLGRGLLLHNGKLCCLGHICHAFNIPLTQLNQAGCLWQIYERYWGNLPFALRPYIEDGERLVPELATEIMRVNDDNTLPAADKEHLLWVLCATAGIDLSFEGDT